MTTGTERRTPVTSDGSMGNAGLSQIEAEAIDAAGEALPHPNHIPVSVVNFEEVCSLGNRHGPGKPLPCRFSRADCGGRDQQSCKAEPRHGPGEKGEHYAPEGDQCELGEDQIPLNKQRAAAAPRDAKAHQPGNGAREEKKTALT